MPGETRCGSRSRTPCRSRAASPARSRTRPPETGTNDMSLSTSPRSSIAVLDVLARHSVSKTEVQACARVGVDDVPGLRLSALVGGERGSSSPDESEPTDRRRRRRASPASAVDPSGASLPRSAGSARSTSSSSGPSTIRLGKSGSTESSQASPTGLALHAGVPLQRSGDSAPSPGSALGRREIVRLQEERPPPVFWSYFIPHVRWP